MLQFTRRFGRLGIVWAILCAAGCVVEQPRQPAPPKSSPPMMPPPSSAPPNVPPAPRTYTGSYSERLEAATRDALAGTPVRIVRSGNTVKLIVPVNFAFALNSSQLQLRFTAPLDNIARLCREYNKSTISVKGFTDSTGSFEHNQTLSEQRAQAIGAYLASRDILSSRIHTAGYGPRNPIADNNTDIGRAQNRRVEIEMVTTP